MNRRIAVRYARALGLAIPEDAGLEAASAGLRALSNLPEGNGELRAALFNNAIALDRRRKVLND